MERRISFLEDTLRNAQIIDKSSNQDVVGIGCDVTIVEKGEEHEETYCIVGAAEANPREGKVSHESPLGKALMGQKVGARVKVETPEGRTSFRIRSIN